MAYWLVTPFLEHSDMRKLWRQEAEVVMQISLDDTTT